MKDSIKFIIFMFLCFLLFFDLGYNYVNELKDEIESLNDDLSACVERAYMSNKWLVDCREGRNDSSFDSK